jgi:hypothetical protein
VGEIFKAQAFEIINLEKKSFVGRESTAIERRSYNNHRMGC